MNQLNRILSAVGVTLALFLLTSATPISNSFKETEIPKTAEVFLDLQYDHMEINDLSREAWKKGMVGYIHLLIKGRLENPRYLTITDFTKPSTEERLWVIDLMEWEVAFHSLVAHGRNSGGLVATKFSNTPESYQSSLGFYVTGETYRGKFDYALRLDGVEKSNSLARERGIVVHGAHYANPEFAKSNGMLGRSLGCPAVPQKLAKEFIDLVKEGTCFFIYAEDPVYLRTSSLIRFVPGMNDITELACTLGVELNG